MNTNSIVMQADWDQQLAQNPDRYFCLVCRQPWWAKAGRRGHNRCINCGAIYSHSGLFKVPTPPDREMVKLLVLGTAVRVRRYDPRLPGLLADDINRILARLQTVGITGGNRTTEKGFTS